MKIRYIVVILFISAILCGCQPNPQNEIVTSKNNGMFEDIIHQEPLSVESSTVHLNYSDSFFSTDGSVEYSWNIDQTINVRSMPVLEVVPDYLTGEEIQQIAAVIFGDAVFYDLGPVSERRYSCDELQSKIAFLSQYANSEALFALMGDDEDISYVRNRLNYYTEQLQESNEDFQKNICDWTLKKESYYEDLAGAPEQHESKWLVATTKIDQIDYYIRAYVRQEKDYQLNSVFVGVGDGNDNTYLEQEIMLAQMCQTEEPSQVQIDAVNVKAQEYLDNLNSIGLGEFIIADTSVEIRYYGDTPGYHICVQAVPCFQGVNVLLEDKGQSYLADEYSSLYAVTECRFHFTANCELISFTLSNPVKVKQHINTSVATLSIDNLIVKAQNHLALYDAEALDQFTGNLHMLQALTGQSVDTLDCKVKITGVKYGLGRFKVPNSDSYYYAPAIIVEGTIDYYNKGTDEIVTGTGNPYGERIQTLVMINAVDGSIG